MMPIPIGSFNESGFIKNFDRHGVNENMASLELASNSIDAGADTIDFVVCNDSIKLIDNGKGMDDKEIVNMADLYRSNHMLEESIGISGIGGTMALCAYSRFADQ